MAEPDNLRHTTMALSDGSGAMPALGFGTLIPNPAATRVATKAALEAGFRVLDTAERYRTEKEVGEGMRDVFKAGELKRGGGGVITQLGETKQRPGRGEAAFEGSPKRP